VVSLLNAITQCRWYLDRLSLCGSCDFCPGCCICKDGEDRQVNVQPDTRQSAHPQREHSPLVLEMTELTLKEQARLHA